MTTVMRRPARSPANVTPLLERILSLNPERVLDVGAGYGEWAILLRAHASALRQIDAVEPVELWGNFSPAPEVYDLYLTVDLTDPLAAGLQDSYDVVLMDGYLDRLAKPSGIKSLERALRLAPRVIVAFDGRSRWAGIIADFIADRAGDVFYEDFSGAGQIRGELWRPACDA